MVADSTNDGIKVLENVHNNKMHSIPLIQRKNVGQFLTDSGDENIETCVKVGSQLVV